ncbi:EAL domain-containing protein [Duganella violaceipulchra]|uniref:Diguanylate cyclase (GGDEF)-like protein/PAS domain S-box-containing protein n=1 Tax=Duganella violaceipulchra TaxID=2849652 RepID=A0AA41KZL7_9BURK|nr:EAL domain-containing protein [Duganella violaceicalia]MBV6320771.1 EAL domain-containing protein [Duganella violaceicalia]MCP2008518.1 diguanylate cyclase (GGDEF)-like protein/PAS domain S-box-containing protein [Duganella violaceicalia]
MEKSQRHLRMALDAARMTIWDSELSGGKVIDSTVKWIGAGTSLLGLPAGDLTQPFSIFLLSVDPADRDQLLDAMQSAVDRRTGYEVEYRVLWPDGSRHWLAAKAHVFCDEQQAPVGTLGVVWDITERKEAEQATARQRELAAVTLRSIGEGVITTNADGVTDYLNYIAEQLTGWTVDQARGLHISATLKLIDDAGAPIPEHAALQCLRLRQAIGVSSQNQLVTREGRRIAVEESAAPIWSDSGELLGAVVVFRDVSHERKLSKQLSWNASHDTLTGLINRREFEVQIAAALHSAKQDNHVHALLYMDLDQFKIVNDTCGHSAGDLLLQLLAKMLQTQMRDSDILARLGGDELGVLLPHCPPDQALLIADQLRQSIKNFRFVWDHHTFELGVSIGLVEINHHSKSMTELLIAADQACYLAKERGRNRVHLYQESDLRLARRQGEMLWVSRLNEAFEHQYFRLYAQPIVGLGRHDGTHDEVLIRIQPAKGDLILPGAFIPAAERYDMMTAIDRWVIRAICRHLQNLRAGQDAGTRRTPARYSVNLSGASLSDEGLHDYIIEQFAEHGIDPGQICFEITETAVIANLIKAQDFMAGLKALGCRFSLDDFGSGLSSFAYLKALPVDYLKIDGIFIRDIATNTVNRAMVKAINEVGHVMGLCTVAEYVEDEPTLAVVRELGLDYAQGYAVGMLRPLSA